MHQSKSPLVSIIIPIFNCGLYLEETLLSVSNQTLSDWECILVNDGSTDNTPDIIKKAVNSDGRFKSLTQNNLGSVAAMNAGLKIAQGRFVTRMDGDDLMPSRRLEIMCGILENEPRKTIITGMVKYFSESTLGDGFKKYEKWLNSLIDEKDHYRDLFKECVVPSPGWLMDRELFKSLGFFRDGIYPEDYDFIFRILLSGFKIKKTRTVILEWRDHLSRSSRTLERYRDQSFFHLKAEYLPLFYPQIKTRGTVVWGIGRKGKMFIASLQKKNIPILNIITDNENKHNTDFNKIEILSPEILKKDNKPFVLICVSQRGAAEEIEKYLINANYKESIDYKFCL